MKKVEKSAPIYAALIEFQTNLTPINGRTILTFLKHYLSNKKTIINQDREEEAGVHLENIF